MLYELPDRHSGGEPAAECRIVYELDMYMGFVYPGKPEAREGEHGEGNHMLWYVGEMRHRVRSFGRGCEAEKEVLWNQVCC